MMHRTSRCAAFSIWLCLFAAPAPAVTFVVDDASETADSDTSDGVCRDFTGRCTLRAAVDQANALAGPDRIEFDLPALPSVPPIVLFQSLEIHEALVVDGYSQTGASVNTRATGFDAVVPVTITGLAQQGILVAAPDVTLAGLTLDGFGIGVSFDGSLRGVVRSRVVGSRLERCSIGAWFQPESSGARVGGPLRSDRNLIGGNGHGVEDRGSSNFVVNNLIGSTDGTPELQNSVGVLLDGSDTAVSDNVISGNGEGVVIFGAGNTLVRNRIGTTPDGLAGIGNGTGIRLQSLESAAQNRIGFPAAGRTQGNLISGNDIGIWILGPGGGNLVQGNEIGLAANGTPLPNTQFGIDIHGSRENVIGAPAGVIPTHEGNRIAHNGLGGIGLPFTAPVLGNGLHNALRANLLFDNTPMDVDLGANGSIDDDPLDLDFGPNELQNPPRIQGVTSGPGGTRLVGELEARAGDYQLDFYASAGCDGGEDTGRAERYLGTASITAAPTLLAPVTPFDVTLAAQAPGSAFTAMATSQGGDSSELGPCYSIAAPGTSDLALALSLSATVFDPGDPITAKLTVRNDGPGSATDVHVRVLESAAIASLDGSADLGSFDPSTGVWSVGPLANGGRATLDLAGTIDASAGGPHVFVARADEMLSQPDPDVGDNIAHANFAVRTGADLEVELTPALQSGAPGQQVVFDVTVTNHGPERAYAVVVTGAFGDGLVVEADPIIESTPAGWRSVVGDLEKDASVHLAVFARVESPVALPSGLQHSVSASSATEDPSQQLATAVVGTPRVAELGLSNLQFVREGESSGPGPVRSGPFWTVTLGQSFEFGTDASPAIRVFACGPVEFGRCDEVRNCEHECVLEPPFGYPVDLSFGDASDTYVQVALEQQPTGPYYDPDPTNDVAQAYTSRISCGLLGIEAPLALGLARLLRRRRARRALGVLITLAVVAPVRADATPLALAIDGTASTATFSLATPLGDPVPQPVTIGGTLAADVALGDDPLFGPTVASLRLDGAALGFSDASFTLESFPLYALTFGSEDLGASLASATRVGVAVALGTSLVDVSGTALRIGAGRVTAGGSYFGEAVSEALELGLLPLTSFLPAGSVAQARWSDLGGGASRIELRIPFTAALTLSIDGSDSTFTLAGTLVSSGTLVQVPEPGTGALTALGLAGCAALRRRRRALPSLACSPPDARPSASKPARRDTHGAAPAGQRGRARGLAARGVATSR